MQKQLNASLQIVVAFLQEHGYWYAIVGGIDFRNGGSFVRPMMLISKYWFLITTKVSDFPTSKMFDKIG